MSPGSDPSAYDQLLEPGQNLIHSIPTDGHFERPFERKSHAAFSSFDSLNVPQVNDMRAMYLYKLVRQQGQYLT